MAPIRMTNASIRELCVAPGSDQKTASGKPVLQKIYADSELKGFGVVATRTVELGEPTRTFYVQREVNGRSVRVKIGRLGDISTEEARRRAKILIGDMIRGINPNAEKIVQRARGVTLAAAAAAYREKPARRTRGTKSLGTLANHDHFARTLGDWGARALQEITRAEVLARHKRLTKENGRVAANGTMRWFRAVYNAALVVHEKLPPNPCIVLTDYWNKEQRKRRPIPWEMLPEWTRWVEGDLRARNPVRADLLLFLLFSGLRREDAVTIMRTEVALDFDKVFRPKPKGGEDRAYDMPLSNFLADIIRRRMQDNAVLYGASCDWVFPTFAMDGTVGHVSEPKEKGRPSPHRLRDTYATAAHEAHVPSLDQKILMNHMLPEGGDVTEGYKRPSWDYLVVEQQRVTDFLRMKTRASGNPILRQTFAAGNNH